MSVLDLFTWIAALVLIAGSLAVFVWFLFDVRSMLGRDREESRRRGPNDVA